MPTFLPTGVSPAPDLLVVCEAFFVAGFSRAPPRVFPRVEPIEDIIYSIYKRMYVQVALSAREKRKKSQDAIILAGYGRLQISAEHN